ncbi:MAG: hypothetical protein FWC97_09455, partial [Treponema sp.]|nr:hypothetical protein [Treponema sp.]
MKKTKFIGFLAIFTVISFTMIACDAENGNGECAHIWGSDAVTLPTCFAGGFTMQTCTRCPETRQINLTSAFGGHNWGNDILTPPTCLVDGFTTQTCTRCPETRQISPTSAIGHNWNWGTHVAGSGLRECQHSGCTVTAGIGDIGPGGGVIFYVRGVLGFTFFQNATDTTGVIRHYLEASPANLGSLQWANNWFLIPGLSQNSSDPTDWAIGRGMKNTEIIIAHGIANSYTTGAATAARGFGADWFLPSRNELNALFQNRAAVGNLGTGWFWSSSQ